MNRPDGNGGAGQAVTAAAPAVRQGEGTQAQAAGAGGWAGPGFSRPGPEVPEVPRDLYRAALEDALAYTTDRDGCPDCDRDRLCETHTTRAARARQYEQELEKDAGA